MTTSACAVSMMWVELARNASGAVHVCTFNPCRSTTTSNRGGGSCWSDTRHHLPLRQHLDELVPERLRGLDRQAGHERRVVDHARVFPRRRRVGGDRAVGPG